MFYIQETTIPNCSRNYGIDALRIISMLMVVMLHVLSHGGILNASESVNYWITWLFEISAYCAVNCYALISGYVGVYSKYRFSNFAVLWFRVAYYSISITLIVKVLFPDEINNNALIYSLFPICSKRYWYFTAYALLFLFIPVLNEGLNRLSKRRIKICLLAIVVTTSIIQPFISVIWGDIFGLEGGHSTWWLMILYLIGGYIRKYGLIHRIKTHRTIILLFFYSAFVLATWFSKLLIQFISIQVWGEIKADGLLIDYQSITILGAAVSLLLAFENIRFHSKLIKIISFFSPLAFSVYLIHEHPLIIKVLIYDKFVMIAKYPSFQMILSILGIVIGIYLLCSFIDIIRHYLFLILRIKERLFLLEIKIRNKILDKTGMA